MTAMYMITLLAAVLVIRGVKLSPGWGQHSTVEKKGVAFGISDVAAQPEIKTKKADSLKVEETLESMGTETTSANSRSLAVNNVDDKALAKVVVDAVNSLKDDVNVRLNDINVRLNDLKDEIHLKDDVHDMNIHLKDNIDELKEADEMPASSFSGKDKSRALQPQPWTPNYSTTQLSECFNAQKKNAKNKLIVDTAAGGISALFAAGGSMMGAVTPAATPGAAAKRSALHQVSTHLKPLPLLAVAAAGMGLAGAATNLAGPWIYRNHFYKPTPNCVEKGLNTIIDGLEHANEGIDKIQTAVVRTNRAVQQLQSSVTEHHDLNMKGQADIMNLIRDEVDELEANQNEILNEARVGRAQLQASIGLLDEELAVAVSNQNTLGFKLDQLSLQLRATEKRLASEAYAASAALVISNAQRIAGAVEDVQDIMDEISKHRASLHSLTLQGEDAIVNALKWGATEKRQMEEFRNILRQAWTTGRDAFTSMTVSLSEGGFLRKYFLEGLQNTAEEYVAYNKRHPAYCDTVVGNMAPMIEYMGANTLDISRLMDVLTSSAQQIHDLFRTMIMIFGRSSVSHTLYKESLHTFLHTVERFTAEISNSGTLLELVQDLVAPVLAVECPLSAACREAVFLSSVLAQQGRGVQISQDVIGFEPLCDINALASSCHASFWGCTAKPEHIEASFNDEGEISMPTLSYFYGATAQPKTNHRNGRIHHANGGPYVSQSTSYGITSLFSSSDCKDHSGDLSCNDNAYRPSMFPDSPSTQVFIRCVLDTWYVPKANVYSGQKCDQRICWHSDEYDEEWRYNLKWEIRPAGQSTWATLSAEHFICTLNENEATSSISAQQLNDSGDAHVDPNHQDWELGGIGWDELSGQLLAQLNSSAEYVTRRGFLVTSDQKCAESLPHGPFVIEDAIGDQAGLRWDMQEPRLCWDCYEDTHDRWLQSVVVASNTNLSCEIVWQFQQRQSLYDRLIQANSTGVEVTWHISCANGHEDAISGTWYYSQPALCVAQANWEDAPIRGCDSGYSEITKLNTTDVTACSNACLSEADCAGFFLQLNNRRCLLARDGCTFTTTSNDSTSQWYACSSNRETETMPQAIATWGMWTVVRQGGPNSKTDTFCGKSTDVFSIACKPSDWCKNNQNGAQGRSLVNQDGQEVKGAWYCCNQLLPSISSSQFHEDAACAPTASSTGVMSGPVEAVVYVNSGSKQACAKPWLTTKTITSSSACVAAASQLGGIFDGNRNWNDRCYGCLKDAGGNQYHFNTNTNGQCTSAEQHTVCEA
jgi:hypothetical protein